MMMHGSANVKVTYCLICVLQLIVYDVLCVLYEAFLP